MSLPTFEQIRGEAYRLLGDAADWLRSDWSPVGSALTEEQAKGRREALRHIGLAKDALNDAARLDGRRSR